MFRIDPEIHRDLDGLVELGIGALLDELDRLGDRIELDPVNALARLRARAFRYAPSPYPTISRPIERAEPSIIRRRRLDRGAIEIGQFLLGDLLDLRAS